MICQVALEGAGLGYDKPYTYKAPADMTLRPGCRVRVPFGRGDRQRVAMVLSVSAQAPEGKCKEVMALLDQEPLLSEELVELALWLRENTFCTYFDAFRAMLPPGMAVKLEYVYALTKADCPAGGTVRQLTVEQHGLLLVLGGQKRPVTAKKALSAAGLGQEGLAALESLCAMGAVEKFSKPARRVGDEKTTMIRLREDILELASVRESVTAAQKRLLELLIEVRQGNLKEVCYYAGVSRSVADKLRGLSLVEYYVQEHYRRPQVKVGQCSAKPEKARLSPSQTEAFRGLRDLWQKDAFSTALLYGVTGSGKTQVFMELLEMVLAAGQGAILLVPEIALTPQTVSRFQGYFGDHVAVLHSGLSMGERLDEWKRVRRGEARLVVGTRSAVFAPVQKLGLVIMDEEQESSYQSERSPRYHARTVAARRMAQRKGLLVLASATPAIETYHYASTGVYHRFTLKERYGGAKLPDVFILDMAAPGVLEDGEGVSVDLLGHLRLVLEKKEQAILLLNRRGYHTTTKCAVCGHVAQCPSCSVALTFHSVNGSLMCHYCGYIQRGDAPCQRCGKPYKRYSGLGIQKVQEELERRLPQGRILRMDTDSTVSRYAYERQFGAFSAGEYDILLGTQMVAKGLDFPNVTLVGVLNADASLYAQDYRSSARAFSLFTQVVGRGGRGNKPGLAFLQTYTPDNRLLELAACQDYKGFYAMEIESRRLHLYPPYCQMMAVVLSAPDWQLARDCGHLLAEELARRAGVEYSGMPLRILGPTPPPMSKLAGQYRQRILLKCRFDGGFRQYLWACLLWAEQNPAFREVRVTAEPF